MPSILPNCGTNSPLRLDFHRAELWARCGNVRVSWKPKHGFLGNTCRALMASGAQDGPLHCYDEHGILCLTVNSLRACSKLDVSENDKNGPRFSKWLPTPEGTFPPKKNKTAQT
jgi:hypothetical protein